jgi:DNA-binding CsgD family transcriptional regulator
VQAGDVVLAAQHLLDAVALARAIPGPMAAYSLLATIPWLHAMSDHESVVWLDAVLAPLTPVLAASLPPGFARSLEIIVATSRRSLDDERADAARRRAAGVSVTDALPEVDLLIRRLTPAGARTSNVPHEEPPPDVLTARQLEVLRLLASGHTNREIARDLNVAPKTVMHHLTATYRAIGVRSRSEATAWAFRHHVAS